MIDVNKFVKKIEEGPVSFLMLDAKYDQKVTKNGVKDVLELEVEIQSLDQSDGRKESISSTLFIDYFERSQFYLFVNAVAEGVKLTAFEPSELIGLEGKAKLSYYKPEGYIYAFPRLNEWVFYQKSSKVAEALAEYETEEVEEVKETETTEEAEERNLDFELTDEDINF